MKNPFHNIIRLVIILLMPVFLHAQMQMASANRFFEKNDIHKDTKIVIKSDFSEIKVNTWDKQDFYAQVSIEVRGKNKEKVKRVLDHISIEYTTNDESIVLQSHFPKNKSGVRYKVIFSIKIPKSNPLVIHSNFSDINVGETFGPVEIFSDYSKIILDRLHHEENLIEGDFNSQGKIGFVRGLRLKTEYSDWNIDLGFKVIADLEFTSLQIDRLKTLTFDGDYNKIHIKRIKNFDAETDFSTLRIGKVYKMNLDGDYNKIFVQQLPQQFKMIQIEGDFNEIEIANPRKTPFKFEIFMEYGNFDIVNDADVHKTEEGTLEKHIKGTYKNAETGGFIRLNLEHSNVKIINNIKTEENEKN